MAIHKEEKLTTEDAVTIAMEVIRWFTAPVKDIIPAYLNRDNFRLAMSPACPMYRGFVVRLPTLKRFTHDYTLIPGEISGHRGLRTIKNHKQHSPMSCPNTIFHLQTKTYDLFLGTDEEYRLLFYHQDSQSILDLKITVQAIDDEDCVTLSGKVFIPLPPQRYIQTKRYIFVRQREIEIEAEKHINRALQTPPSFTDADQKQFYIDLAEKLGIEPIFHRGQGSGVI